MNGMTVTLSMPALVALVAACILWGAVIGAALMLDVLRTDTLPPMHVSLDRLADPDPLPGELAPFPVDTAPLLLLSEAMAAVDGHEREIQAMMARADKLGLR